jgi:hypothetical protein
MRGGDRMEVAFPKRGVVGGVYLPRGFCCLRFDGRAARVRRSQSSVDGMRRV